MSKELIDAFVRGFWCAREEDGTDRWTKEEIQDSAQVWLDRAENNNAFLADRVQRLQVVCDRLDEELTEYRLAQSAQLQPLEQRVAVLEQRRS